MALLSAFCQHTWLNEKSIHRPSRVCLRSFPLISAAKVSSKKKIVLPPSFPVTHLWRACGADVGPEANAQNLNPAGGSQAGLCKKLFRRNKKNSINTKPATQPLLLYIFFIRLSSAQSAFYLPSTPPTAMARRSPLS